MTHAYRVAECTTPEITSIANMHTHTMEESATAAAGEDPLTILSKSWFNLRLSVRCSARVSTWDAILLTASSPEQALLYQWNLDYAKERGTIASSTVALAIPDPLGCRIGSGGATLHAIRSLFLWLRNSSSSSAEGSAKQDHESEIKLISDMKILLVHAGGDSKRVPWANPIGKAFLPLPFLAENEPNSQVPSLFDHILAISSYTAQQFKNKGGLFIMTGDVLPCYDFSDFMVPEDGACIVSVPAALSIACNHGVILTFSEGKKSVVNGQVTKLEQVSSLIQKPTYNELLERGAIRSDGRVLLDTGIFAVRGKAWRDLIGLSIEEPDPISALLEHQEEISLYEEIAGAWVPACHEWIKTRPLGVKLLEALSSEFLFSFCAQDLSFLHFGTSLEVLAHLSKDHDGRVGRRHMILVFESTFTQLASSAIILSSEIKGDASVGEKSLVYKCTFTDSVDIGNNCIVLGIHSNNLRGNQSSFSLVVPDDHCLWGVPVFGNGPRVTLCCSVHDNPKLALTMGGTFCGKSWKEKFDELRISENDVWPNHILNDERTLWNAKLFPVVAPEKGVVFAMWLMGVYQSCSGLLHEWKMCDRVSLSRVHRQIDFHRFCNELDAHQSRIALGLAKGSLQSGLLDRDLSKLCKQIVKGLDRGTEICKDLLTFFSDLRVDTWKVPLSRVYQAQLDISKACNYGVDSIATYEKHVWDAVAEETLMAIHQNQERDVIHKQPGYIFPVIRAKVELPVRIDFAGGWSDTPPWSLERVGKVLNMAICIDGLVPIGSEIIVTSNTGISLIDDGNHQLIIEDLSTLSAPFEVDDPFRLVKSALIVTEVAYSSALKHNGLSIRTWANVPRGSGLGTSSILAAAVVKCILSVMGRDGTNTEVTNLVLLLEQLMGTGGGWQDQIGGLYPSLKCTTSFPRCPLMLVVEHIPIAPSLQKELEDRLVIFFTGQVRLAHNVLQNVVRRYLQRDTTLISAIEQLVSLAEKCEEAIKLGNLDILGKIMLDVWLLHQELDPFCSNEFIDLIFKQVHKYTCGYKLVGAGGGGFAMLIAKDKHAAKGVKEILQGLSVKVYNWSLFYDSLRTLSN